jgi:hypothetical protein
MAKLANMVGIKPKEMAIVDMMQASSSTVEALDWEAAG